jgi:hypothetical protein
MMQLPGTLKISSQGVGQVQQKMKQSKKQEKKRE